MSLAKQIFDILFLQLEKKICINEKGFALVAEQVDAADLKSVGSNPVPVRFRPSAPIKQGTLRGAFSYVKISKTTQKFLLVFIMDLYYKQAQME